MKTATRIDVAPCDDGTVIEVEFDAINCIYRLSERRHLYLVRMAPCEAVKLAVDLLVATGEKTISGRQIPDEAIDAIVQGSE